MDQSNIEEEVLPCQPGALTTELLLHIYHGYSLFVVVFFRMYLCYQRCIENFSRSHFHVDVPEFLQGLHKFHGGGNILFINYGGDFSGGVRYYGTWGPASSRELKENFKDFSTEDALNILQGLNPLRFNFIADERKTLHIGFIAEDVPDAIASEDRKSIIPNHIIAVLTKVVKEQQKTIEVLTQKVNSLGIN